MKLNIKSLLYLIVIVMFTGNQVAFSQWVDKGEYEEMDINIFKNHYTKVSYDSSAFFLQSVYELYKISLLNGEVVDTIILKNLMSNIIYNYIGSCSISNDDKYYAYPEFIDQTICINTYLLDNDSLISQIKTYERKPSDLAGPVYEPQGSSIIFYHDKNEMMVGVKYVEKILGSETWYYGNLKSYNTNTGDLITLFIEEKGIKSLKLSPSQDFLAFYFSYGYSQRIAPRQYISRSDYGAMLYDFSNGNKNLLSVGNHSDLIDDFVIYQQTFSKDSKYLSAYLNDNKLLTWSTETNEIVNEIIFKDSEISVMESSNVNNYLILGVYGNDQKSKILFLDFLNRRIVDSVEFEAPCKINSINHINDSTLLVHFNDGYLRKIPYPESLYETQLFTKDNQIFCYPNPCKDIINIKYYLSGRGMASLSLYNESGWEIKPILDEYQYPGEYKRTIDISELHKGAYYFHLRIDGSVYTGKFVVGE